MCDQLMELHVIINHSRLCKSPLQRQKMKLTMAKWNSSKPSVTALNTGELGKRAARPAGSRQTRTKVITPSSRISRRLSSWLVGITAGLSLTWWTDRLGLELLGVLSCEAELVSRPLFWMTRLYLSIMVTLRKTKAAQGMNLERI